MGKKESVAETVSATLRGTDRDCLNFLRQSYPGELAVKLIMKALRLLSEKVTGDKEAGALFLEAVQ